jgi:hypothetical protein
VKTPNSPPFNHFLLNIPLGAPPLRETPTREIMFASVQSTFPAFSAKFEDRVPYMYLDIKGLVTVGIGNLIDPVAAAQALPFQFKNAPGSFATPDEIAAEWQAVKNDQSLKTSWYSAFESITQLELSDDSIDAVILERLNQNESFLKGPQWFPNFDTWPADAQLGLLSMAWAMGPASFAGFPRFSAACRILDFKTAAAECKMDDTGNAGLTPRNQANFTLFSNAEIILAGQAQGVLERPTLYYPRTLTPADITPAVSLPGRTS